MRAAIVAIGLLSTSAGALDHVRVADLQFSDVTLSPEHVGTMGWWILKGTVLNNSRYPVGYMDFDITLSDCNGNGCHVVGRTTVQSCAPTHGIPPGEARAFNSCAIDIDPNSTPCSACGVLYDLPNLTHDMRRTFSWRIHSIDGQRPE